MSINTTHRVAPWDALIRHPAKSLIYRFGLFAGAAAVSMLVVVAGAAFYAFVFPGTAATPPRAQFDAPHDRGPLDAR
jgi:hypothetical protein